MKYSNCYNIYSKRSGLCNSTMSTHKILPLLVLVFSACEGASLVLKPSTLRISRDGTANFTLNCTLDEDNATGHAELQSEIREVHRMRIAKLENNHWKSIVEMDSDWKAPVVQHDLIDSGVSERFNLVSKYIQARWSMASNSTAGEYSCDLMGYGRNGQGFYLRSPVVYVDAEPPITLYDLYKLVKASEKKISTNEEANNQTNETIEMFRMSNDTLQKTLETVKTNTEMIRQTSIALGKLTAMVGIPNRRSISRRPYPTK